MKLAVLLLMCAAFTLSRAPVPKKGSSILFNGRVNYPWMGYGTDFGASIWGSKGVAENYAKNNDFHVDLHSKKVQVNRWWLFSDSRTGIIYDSNRNPVSIDEKVFGDLDAALEIAMKNNIIVSNVTTAGRTDIIEDPKKQDLLVQNIVIPILQRYARHPAVLAWEEWILKDIPKAKPDPESVPCTFAQFYALSQKIVDAVHHYTDHYATIGGASLIWYRIWTPAYAKQMGLRPLGLDFYQAHYYQWMDIINLPDDPLLGKKHHASPITQNFWDLSDVDRPIVIAEFGHKNRTTGQMIDAFVKQGYAGALVWAYNGGPEFPIDWPSYLEMADKYKNITG